MEIASFLNLTLRRLIALAIAGLLAAAAAGMFALSQPTSYEATAVVFVGQALNPGDSSFNIDPLVADFRSALDLPSVTRAVAKNAKIDEGSIGDVTTFGGDQGGSPATVTYTGTSEQNARLVVSAYATEGLVAVASRQRDRAAIALRTTQASLDTVSQDWNAFQATVDWADIDAERAEALAAYEGDQRTPEQAKVLARLTEAQNRSEGLKLQISNAQQELSNARARVARAEAALVAARAPELVSVTDVRALSKTSKVARSVVATAVVIVALGGVVIVVADRRRNALTAMVAPYDDGPRPPARLAKKSNAGDRHAVRQSG